MILMKISSGGDGTKNAIFVDAGLKKLLTTFSYLENKTSNGI